MKRNFRGQSLLEYMSIVILIMLGMIIGKTVIDRGAKAGIKNLTDSIEDSDLEILGQAPPGNYSLPQCNCGLWTPQDCGLGPCAETEMYETRICLPLGCEIQFNIITERCISIGSCCTDWTLLGAPAAACGVNASSFGSPPGGPGPGGCLDDQGWSTRQCGGIPLPPPELDCRYDMLNPSQCWFRCGEGGAPLPSCFTPCDPPPGPCGPGCPPCINPPCTFHGDNARLNADKNYILKPSSASCNHIVDPTEPCKAYCNPGLAPNGGFTDCVCGGGMFPRGSCVCECPTGFFFPRSCPTTTCDQASCGSAQQCINSN